LRPVSGTGAGDGWTQKMRRKRLETKPRRKSKVLGFPRRLDVDTAQKATASGISHAPTWTS